MAALLVSCSSYSSDQVIMRHLYVIYHIDTTGNSAIINVALKANTATGDTIYLSDDDYIKVNDIVTKEEGDGVYKATITKAPAYIFSLNKSGNTYSDIVSEPAKLNILPISSPVVRGTPFDITWDNCEEGTTIVLNFSTAGGANSTFFEITDNFSKKFSDTSEWLNDMPVGTVNLTGYRTKVYSVNPEFAGGTIQLKVPVTGAARLELTD